jgi:hypothetical protein
VAHLVPGVIGLVTHYQVEPAQDSEGRNYKSRKLRILDPSSPGSSFVPQKPELTWAQSANGGCRVDECIFKPTRLL